jgi:glycosyltransferase involved in cell wall biosynthesis
VKNKIKVLWTTNEDPQKQNSLVYLISSMKDLENHGIDAHLECIGSLKTPHAFWQAVRHIQSISNSFDIIHSQYGSACGLATSLSTNRLKILTLRGSDWTNTYSSCLKTRSHNFAAKFLTLISLRRYSKVITVSNRIAASIRRLQNAPPVTVRPSAIDLDKFKLIDRQIARTAIGEGSDQRAWILFTSLSIYDPNKRYQLACDAFNIANQSFGGNLRFKLLSEVPHEMVPLHVAACDVILCTSQSEGWPNCIKEAMACGIPFVSTDVSDLKEISQLAPNCKVCSERAADLANALIEILNTPSNRAKDGLIIRSAVESMSTKVSSKMLADIYKTQHEILAMKTKK